MIIMGRKRSSPMNVLSKWVKKQSMRMKISLGAMIALLALVALKHAIHDLNDFYIGSEFTHALGIIVLIYKLTTKKTCSGTCTYIYILALHVFLLSIFKITRSCCCWSVLSSALNYLLLFSFLFSSFLRNIYLFKLSTYFFRFHMLFGEFII